MPPRLFGNTSVPVKFRLVPAQEQSIGGGQPGGGPWIGGGGMGGGGGDGGGALPPTRSWLTEKMDSHMPTGCGSTAAAAHTSMQAKNIV